MEVADLSSRAAILAAAVAVALCIYSLYVRLALYRTWPREASFPTTTLFLREFYLPVVQIDECYAMVERIVGQRQHSLVAVVSSFYLQQLTNKPTRLFVGCLTEHLSPKIRSLLIEHGFFEQQMLGRRGLCMSVRDNGVFSRHRPFHMAWTRLVATRTPEVPATLMEIVAPNLTNLYYLLDGPSESSRK